MARGDYSFVIDSTFQPFTMQELLTPFVMYKDAYDKMEQDYIDLAKNADTFKYLEKVAEENPDSDAAKIYKGYTDEMNKRFSDFSKNGLHTGNRRALLNLKKRYQGEIGMLARADEQLKELQKQRNALIASGKSMLYANENPTIDDFLEGKEPFNRYSIDQDALRALGMQEGQAASSRIYGSTKVNDITKYYQEILQTQGYSPELINQFRQSLEAIPEFRDAVNSIMEERGINQNLKGVNWQRAKDSIVNGIIAGSVYKEARGIQPNPGVMTAAQEASNKLGWAEHDESVRQHNLQMKIKGFDKKGIYNSKNDQELEKAKAMAKASGELDTNGNPVTSNRKSNRKLQENRFYDGKGNVSPISKNSSSVSYGKPIDYGEAIKKDPNVVYHDPGNEKDYDYFERNGGVSVIQKPGAEQQSTSSSDSSEDKHNAY